jgi:hypothetical protein
MSGYREQAERLAAARQASALARQALARARDAALRGGRAEEAERAERTMKSALAEEATLRATLDSLAVGAAGGREHDLAAVAAAVATLDDGDPWLLFPLRLETRFRSFREAGGAERHELWLRIFPDDCVIDTYEPVPSEAEIRAAQLYWLNVWRAGGSDSGRRAAWKGLVGSCGAGRAAWLLREYTPVGPPPTKSPAHDTLLVGASLGPPDPAVAAALARYWPAVWTADGDRAALDAARVRLKADLGFANPAAAGADAAADAAIALAPPFNLRDAPTAPGTRTTPPARYLIVEFPPTVATQRAAWGSAPRAEVLPDRFVAFGYTQPNAAGAQPDFVAVGAPVPSPLIVGLDPNAPRGEQFDPHDGELEWGDDIKWLADFDAAVAKGMGLRIPLTATQRRTGFARIVVVGVRASADSAQGQALLETLLEHHRDGRAGLSLLPQGTATNNVEEQPAQVRLAHDADASFAVAFGNDGVPQAGADWSTQHDGARFAAALGVSLDVLRGVRGVNGSDQREARAMQRALFPGTLGYFLREMIGPAIGPEAFAFLRAFLIDLVSGRGPVPALRIGAQPYGVLPTTAFSRLAFDRSGNDDRRPSYLERTNRALQALAPRWAQMASDATWVGKRGDPHRVLLDVLGQHPASVEFHRRTMESLEEHLNRTALLAGGELNGAIAASIESALRLAEVPQLLASLGLAPDAELPLARRLFQNNQVRLDGPVVDEAPLSETEPLGAATADGRSYLAWLAAEARRDMEALRRQSGFAGDRPPRALLYLILRFSLLSGYRHAGIDRLLVDGVIDAGTALAWRRDPLFVHVKDDGASESRWGQLYAQLPGQGMRLHQRLTADLAAGNGAPGLDDLTDQLDAIEQLKDLPTARLERLFVEHFDCLSWRVDAWRTALVTQRLRELRAGQQPRSGILLGAYGWVENVRPRATALQPASAPADLAAGLPQSLLRDPANQGFIHAPSLDHAVTAAVLRNGHMSAADPARGDELSIDLSSARVRRALEIFEGMQEGQSLGALLGYQFERGLHEGHAPLRLDKFIQPLRNVLPLQANRLPDTQTSQPTEAIIARNVIDGRKLAQAVRARAAYPFGLAGLPAADGAESAALAREADRLLDTLDAVSDLAMAESVHQMTRGNFERAAGVLDAFARGSTPPEPEITRTPRTGTTLTHRVALHLDPAPPAPPVATPRASVEPRLDAWAGRLLPALSGVACRVLYDDLATGIPALPLRVSLAELGLSALDLVLMAPDGGAQARAAFDERVIAHACTVRTIAPDARIEIDYATRADAGSITLFELAPLLASLGALLARARAARPADLARPATPYDDPAVTLVLDRAAVADAVAPLEAIGTAAAALATAALASAEAAPAAQRAAIDGQLDSLADLAARAGLYGLPASGGAVADATRAAAAATMRKTAREVADRWRARLATADQQLAEEGALPNGTPAADRIALLRVAEAAVASTAFQAASVPTPAALRTETLAARGRFATRLALFDAVAKSTKRRIADLLADADATLAGFGDFERTPLSFEAAEEPLTGACRSVAASAAALAREAAQRVTAAKAALAAHDAAGVDTTRAEALDKAAKALFGDAFFIVAGARLGTAPRADGGPSQHADWNAAITGAPRLLDHLEQVLKRVDPVDEWLAAAARVRAPLKHLERAAILSEGFGAAPTTLTAFQLPYATGDSWLGAEFPPDRPRPADPLLYTAALHARAWNAAQPLYALVIDEWVETLPHAEETTGLAFHFDRPNAEPPQAWLLVAPPRRAGRWVFDDVVAAVNETLDLAHQRAVEPAQIDGGPFARFLPATLFSTAHSDITLIADLALNNFATYTVARDTR